MSSHLRRCTLTPLHGKTSFFSIIDGYFQKNNPDGNDTVNIAAIHARKSKLDSKDSIGVAVVYARKNKADGNDSVDRSSQRQ